MHGRSFLPLQNGTTTTQLMFQHGPMTLSLTSLDPCAQYRLWRGLIPAITHSLPPSLNISNHNTRRPTPNTKSSPTPFLNFTFLAFWQCPDRPLIAFLFGEEHIESSVLWKMEQTKWVKIKRGVKRMGGDGEWMEGNTNLDLRPLPTGAIDCRMPQISQIQSSGPNRDPYPIP